LADPDARRLLTRLVPILTADDPEAVLGSACRMTAELAEGGALAFLRVERGKREAEHWQGADEEFRELVREDFDRILERVGGPPVDPEVRPLVAADREWTLRVIPLRGERSHGAICVAHPADDRRDRGVWDAIGEIARLVAATLDRQHRLRDARAQKDQIERWFGTMDAQLRVLDRERQKFVAVVNQSDTFLFVADAEHRVTWTNTALAKRLETDGGPEGRRIGQPVDEVLRSLGIDGVESGPGGPLAETFRTHRTGHREVRRHRGGEARDIYVTFLPIQGADGSTAEVLVMMQDVTDLEVVRRSEARYRTLFERSPDAMVMADPRTGRILLSNPVASSLTGWSAEELSTRTLRDIHAPEDWPVAKAEYTHAFRAGSANGEWHLLGRDGNRVVAQVSANRFDLDGEPVLLLEFRDMTARRMLERELRHSQKMEAIGRLAGGVAHDFNNLLTVILGQSELLSRRMDREDPRVLVTETIRSAAVRGSLLTRQLLAFSRKEVLRSEELDVKCVVAEMQSLLDTLIGEDIRIVTRLDPRPCVVRIDRGHLEQILMNLVVNARDAMPDGGEIRIAVRRTSGARAGRELVELRVADDGIGMDEATCVHVFEPFFTTKGPGEGTGLGLSTVYGIVQDADGTVDVTSAPGQGTELVLSFPLASGTVPVEPAPDPGSAAETAEEDRARAEAEETLRKILLVEDEPDVRDMAREALELGGYAVTPASSGEEALDACREASGEFELLLTDVIMPGMSGGELAQKITRRHPRMKVLYMSGYNDDAIVKHGVSVSAADFLQKPFTLDTLSRKVREILERSPA
jgi:PAS domain S-box-containing protein